MRKPLARAVAFDWGGVFTAGTFDGCSTARLADAHDRDVEAVRWHYFALVHHLEVGEWTLGRFWNELRGRLGLAGVTYAAFEALYLGSVRENAAMYDFLAELDPGYRVGLLSNNYPVVSDRLRADRRLARFHALVFSNEIGVKKPDPAAFQALSNALGVPPQDTVFVDDVQTNLDAAAALGFRTILYDDHASFLERFAAWEARGA